MDAGQLLTAFVRYKSYGITVTPIPYVPLADHAGVDYMWKFYEDYADFIEFENGKVLFVTRYAILKDSQPNDEVTK